MEQYFTIMVLFIIPKVVNFWVEIWDETKQ